MKKLSLRIVSATAILSLTSPLGVLAWDGYHPDAKIVVTNSKTIVNTIDSYLISQGYVSAQSNHREKRIGIMKFQKEMGLRQTGSLNIQTRQAVRKMMRMPTIVETAVSTPTLSTLVTAVKAGGLVEALSGEGPFTVFAPTDSAFAKIPPATLTSLLTPEKKTDLVSILSYHVVPSRALSSDLRDGQEIQTLQGKTLKVKIQNGKIYINNAQVVAGDIKTKNGIVHVIDTVLLP